MIDESILKKLGSVGKVNTSLRCAIFLIALACLGWCTSVKAQQAVTLAWDADTSGSVLGYVVYVGTASEAYTSRFDVGTNTSFTATNLQPGMTNYFAVTAYTAQSESLPSGE